MGSVSDAESCAVLVVDDHPAIYEALKKIISSGRRFQLEELALNGLEAVDKAASCKPDLVLMDINMPRCNGIEAAQELRRRNADLKILFYSGCPLSAEAALAAGGNGFVTKGGSWVTLRMGIDAVLAGGVFVDEIAWRHLKARFSVAGPPCLTLKPQQEEVARLLVQGLTSKEIAVQMNLTRRRVDKVRTQLMALAQVRNAAGLAGKLAQFFRSGP